MTYIKLFEKFDWRLKIFSSCVQAGAIFRSRQTVQITPQESSTIIQDCALFGHFGFYRSHLDWSPYPLGLKELLD
ncbi:hypothetical protein K5D34_10050 [Pseudomonas cichorii]|nr:hypothetical protein [Pseudomonas cichorii]MBX8488750.1 hypothetical protein [Pseudomonas cichorii]MBX8510016.1 hypothetical protein [Pseudomonas cichorii]MBX8525097.1 hypothetical protein [Pseudomonas cichorii]MBX8568771.1 hypothetical protein [Pseudomonas cichorii]